VLAGVTTLPDRAVAAEPSTSRWNGAVSANGWPVIGPAEVGPSRVEGSAASVAVLAGDVAAVLVHVLRRFHYEVRALGSGAVLGHTVDRSVRSAAESNHLSGTAVAIRPDLYPIGVGGGFHVAEVAVVRDILADCEGVVRWGADDPRLPKEGHFQIDVPPGDQRLRRVARTLGAPGDASGRAAGSMPDPFTTARGERAAQLARRQRATR
jgi:hypothetical protein